MADDKVIDVDNQSEEGEIKSTPGREYLTEEVADTADSLDIKPPQTVVRHQKTIFHRREKHSEKTSERRNEKERKSRHHDRSEDGRHRDKHSRHHRQTSTSEKTKRLDPTKRDRESTRHDRKERSTGDRVLEDLRESRTMTNSIDSRTSSRLLDKRRERREETHSYKMEATTTMSMSSTTSSTTRQGERREVRVEELRERREMRLAAAAAAVEEAVSGITVNRERRESRYVRAAESQESYSDVEIIEPQQHQHQEQHHHHQQFHHHHYQHSHQQSVSSSTTRPTSSREKRHKKSHKREKDRDREREKEFGHREKHNPREHHPAMDISVYQELERMEAIAMEQQKHRKQQRAMKSGADELTEQELRRQRLLEAEREMSRRKETSRLELQARRMRRERGEKRPHSPDQVVELSDESVQFEPSPPRPQKPPVEETRETVENESSDSSDSSSSDDDDDDDDDDEDSDDTNDDSAENSEYNERSPRSAPHEQSPRHAESNGATRSTDHNHTSLAIEEEEKVDLPPYYPAIQGCRSVEEYKCLNRIAEGTYGVVYRAEDRRTKEIVALKRLKMEKEKDGFPITSLREINTLLKAQHPNIVTVREIVVGSNMDKIFIVMDYVEHDLKSLMETMKSKNQMFTTGEIKCLMMQLLQAVAHLHDNWILHRDLKTSNLLLSHRGILKVGDFGLAREYGSPLKQYTSIVVTLYYRAPELLLGSKQYSTPVDVWSVGCIFAELLRMEPFFPGQSEIDLLNKIFKELGSPSDKIWPGYSKLPMVKKIPFAHYPVNNLKQRFNLTLSDLGIELLSKFLTYDPAQRITAEEASKHKYFEEGPLPIDPSMFPTWPAKSEFGLRAAMPSPKILNDGKELKQCANKDEDEEDDPLGFHMGSRETSRSLAVGGGFHLKF